MKQFGGPRRRVDQDEIGARPRAACGSALALRKTIMIQFRRLISTSLLLLLQPALGGELSMAAEKFAKAAEQADTKAFENILMNGEIGKAALLAEIKDAKGQLTVRAIEQGFVIGRFGVTFIRVEASDHRDYRRLLCVNEEVGWRIFAGHSEMDYHKLIADLDHGDREVINRLIQWAALTEELLREKEEAEQVVPDRPATAPESKQEGNPMPQSESEGPQ